MSLYAGSGEILDPFADVPWYNLDQARMLLEELPEVEGSWAMPASITRFGWTEMPEKVLKRFFKKIKPYDMGYRDEGRDPGPCWLWQNQMHPKGYGRFYLGFDEDENKVLAYAHRVSFEHFIGIPKPGYIVDHRCEVKSCCNPVHLWPVTNQENLRLADLRSPWKRRNQYSKE